MKQFSVSDDFPVEPESGPSLTSVPASKPLLRRKSSVTSPGASRASLMRRASIQSMEIDCVCKAVAPQIEGRIIVLDKQVT